MGILTNYTYRELASGLVTPDQLGLVTPEYMERRLHLPVQPEGYYDRVIDSEHDQVESGEHHAYYSTPRWTGKFDEALKNTKGRIRVADIGSAFPIYASLLRALSFERAGRKAGEVLIDVSLDRAETDRIFRSHRLGPHASTLHTRFFNRKGLVRPRFRTALQNSIYCIPEQCTDDDLEGIMLYELLTNQHTYTTRLQDTYEGRRHIDTEQVLMDSLLVDLISELEIRTPAARLMARRMGERTAHVRPSAEELAEIRETLPLGKASSYALLGSYATLFAKLLTDRGLTRSFSVHSVDQANPKRIKNDSVTSFSLATRQTGIFDRALQDLDNPDHHKCKDLLSYLRSLEDNSMTYIVSVECFPYFFGSTAEDTAQETAKKMKSVQKILEEICRVLQPGGSFVAIPMNIKGNLALDMAFFSKIRQGLLDAGNVEITIREYSPTQIRAYGDQADSSNATIFSGMVNDALSGDGIFQVLEIKKPERVAAAGTTIPRLKAREVPNPTQ